jgi:tRNA1(Val) A37 N6-methylase TrmN6
MSTSPNWVFAQNQKRHTQDGSNLVFLMKSIGKGLRPVRAIDVGCGDGIIAYDMLINKKASTVLAVEISKDAFVAAEANLHKFVTDEKVEVIHSNVKKIFAQKSLKEKFDLFAINPPFFAEGAGNKNHNKLDQQARYDKTLPIKVWAAGAQKLLKHGGELYCVFATDRMAELISVLRKHGLEPKEIWWAKHYTNQRRFFLRAVKGAKVGVRVFFKHEMPESGHHKL